MAATPEAWFKCTLGDDALRFRRMHGREQLGILESAERGEHTQGVQPCELPGRGGQEPSQRGQRRRVLPLAQEPGGCVTVPAIGMAEQRDELREGGGA